MIRILAIAGALLVLQFIATYWYNQYQRVSDVNTWGMLSIFGAIVGVMCLTCALSAALFPDNTLAVIVIVLGAVCGVLKYLQYY